MEGLCWGAFMGGIFGMGQQLFREEFSSMVEARASSVGMDNLQIEHMHKIPELHDEFICFLESAKSSSLARKKIHVAITHIDKAAGIYVTATRRQGTIPAYSYMTASNHVNVAFTLMRDAVKDVHRAHETGGSVVLDPSALTHARTRIEKNVSQFLSCLHTLTLVK